MKISVLLLTFFAVTLSGAAQVGIGTITPAASLDVIADSATLTQADGIIAPRIGRASLVLKSAAYGLDQTGAIVYINDITGLTNIATAAINGIGYYYFDGTTWQPFTQAGQQSKWTNDTANNRVRLTNTSNGTTGRGTTNSFLITDTGNVGLGIIPDQKLSVNGNINTGGNIELNQLGTGNRNALIDFHSSDTGNPDFKSRLIRAAGDNGSLTLVNRGTGDLIVDALDATGSSLLINGTTGFVGLNKAIPSQQLDVTGSGLFSTNVYVGGVPANGEKGLRIHRDALKTAIFDVNANEPIANFFSYRYSF